MKRLLLSLILFVGICSIYAQTKRQAFSFANGTKAFWVLSDDGKYAGVEDSSGNLIVPIVYGGIGCHGNFILCEKRNGHKNPRDIALYDYKGNQLVSETDGYRNTHIQFLRLDGELIASLDDKIPLIFNSDGKCIYKYRILTDSDGFKYVKNEIADTIVIAPGKYTSLYLDGDVIKTAIGKKVGVTGLNGDVIIPPIQYNYISVERRNGETKGYIVSYKGHNGYYDRNGICILPSQDYSWVRPIDDVIIVKKRENGRCGLVDTLGNMLIMTEYQHFHILRDDDDKWYLQSRLGNGKGKMTLQGKVIEEPKPTLAKEEITDTEFLKVTDLKGFVGIESKDGKVIFPNEYDEIGYINNPKPEDEYQPYFYLYKGGFEGVARNDGSFIIPCNKYHQIDRVKGYGNSYYIVEKMGKCGLCDKDGKEIVAPLYDDIRLHKPGENEKELIIATQGLMEGMLDFKGNIIIPFFYTKIKPETQTGNYEVSLFNKKGICGSDGRVIIPVKYSSIKKESDNAGPYNEIYRVKDGRTDGLFTTDGQMIFPTGFFGSVKIKNGKGNELINEEWYIEANKSILVKYYYDLKGNFLGKRDLEKEILETIDKLSTLQEFDNYCQKAKNEFEKENYKKAIEYYNQALGFMKDGVVYYNIGAAYFNMRKYKDAISSLETCISISETESLKDDASNLILECEQHIQQKRERRDRIALGLLGTAFNVAATIIQNNTIVNKYNSNLKTSQMGEGGFKRDTSYDYLLDPRYAMMQVQQQNWNEYLQMTNGGQTMTYEEWYAIKAQAWAESQKAESGSYSSASSSSSSSSTSAQGSPSGRDCRLCLGTGKCKTCNGKGWFTALGIGTGEHPCPNCQSNHNGRCSSCGGTGKQ